MKKYFIASLLLVLVFVTALYAQSSRRVFPSGHWVYDAVNDLLKESGYISFATITTPLSIAELQLFLADLEYDKLSYYGRTQLERLQNLFVEKRSITELGSDIAKVGMGLFITPEFYFKSNEHIDWTHSFYYKNEFVNFPVYMFFGDYVYMEGDFFLGRNYGAMQRPTNWNNFVVGINEKGLDIDVIDTSFPHTAYINTGISLTEKTMISFQLGRGSQHIGDTLTGSIILSDNFFASAYLNLAFTSPAIKYTLNITQFSTNKYMYTHRAEFRFLKKLQFFVMESTGTVGGFDIRCLNPFMFLHTYGLHNEITKQNFAYFCVGVDAVPIENLRVYFLYSQNEFVAPNEVEQICPPTSIGFQLGAEYNMAIDKGMLKNATEVVYTFPWLYIKHTPQNSLISFTPQNEWAWPENAIHNADTWLGTPFGPDSIAVALRSKYEVPEHWAASVAYTLAMQGTNANLHRVFYDGSKLKTSVDYPVTKGGKSEEGFSPFHDIVRYTNRIMLEGSYTFLGRIEVAAKLAYTVVLNSGWQKNNTQQGVELGLSGKFKLL